MPTPIVLPGSIANLRIRRINIQSQSQSPFTGARFTQKLGEPYWSAEFSPGAQRGEIPAAAWRAFALSLDGMTNPFLLPAPNGFTPRARAYLISAPAAGAVAATLIVSGVLAIEAAGPDRAAFFAALTADAALAALFDITAAGDDLLLSPKSTATLALHSAQASVTTADALDLGANVAAAALGDVSVIVSSAAAIDLSAGWWVQIGSGAQAALHALLTGASVPASGSAAVTVTPPLRRTVAAGEAFAFRNPVGRFRLAAPIDDFQLSPPYVQSLRFRAVEDFQ